MELSLLVTFALKPTKFEISFLNFALIIEVTPMRNVGFYSIQNKEVPCDKYTDDDDKLTNELYYLYKN